MVNNSKKAQGLPLSFIVIAAIAVLILVIVVAFVIFGLGGSFKGITLQSTSDLESVKAACQANCNKLKTGTTTAVTFATSQYCSKKYAVDVDGDGEINTNATSGHDQETELHCYSNNINVPCTVTLSNGEVIEGSETSCKLI